MPFGTASSSKSPFIHTVEPLEDRKLFSTVVALGVGNTLTFVDSAAPSISLGKVKVKGMAQRESLVGIDFRPADGRLYGLGSTSRLYTINPSTGVATAVDSTGAAFSPTLDTSGPDGFGFDFNPAVDRIRVVSDDRQNLRLNPDTGAVVDSDAVTPGTQIDTPLAFAPGDVNETETDPDVVAVAYTNSISGGTPTTLFAIDSETDSLVRIGSVDGTPDSPNGGLLSTIGALGIDATDAAGFDIETTTGSEVAFAALSTSSTTKSSLFTIDLATGAATSIGVLATPGKRAALGLAVLPAGQTILAVDKANKFVIFDSNLPNVALSRFTATGLARGEKIVGIDRRPADDAIFAFTNQDRTYSINLVTGAATVVGTQTDPAVGSKRNYGVDFNPAVDRIRVVNAEGDNFRINPDTGALVDADVGTAGNQLDGPLTYATGDVNAGAIPSVDAVAYSNNIAAAPNTTLYAIDAGLNVLVTIGSVDGTPTSPNTGQISTVGSLTVDPREPVGFDIATINSVDVAFAAFAATGVKASLYTVDLTTGAATAVGVLPRNVKPIGITVLPPLS